MPASRTLTAPVERADWTHSSLGERVEHACRLCGWTLKKLAEEAGFDSGLMSRLSRQTETTGSSPETLRRVAKATGVNVVWLMFGEGPVERVEHTTGALRHHPEWTAALAEAKRWQRGIPNEFWELAGDAVVPAPPRLDWQLIVGLVRELYSAHQRWLEEVGRVGEGEADERPTARAAESGTVPAQGRAPASMERK